MVRVASSRGGMVQVHITGIADTLANLRKQGKEIQTKAELGVAKAADFVKQEVQESIIGNRAEEKSVDTGELANSIEALPVDKGTWIVEPRNVAYPNGQTTQDVAVFMEYGTPHIAERRHFRNTKDRVEPKLKEFFEFDLK